MLVAESSGVLMSAPKWISPTLPSSHVVNVLCDGDSITYGQTWTDAQHTYPYLLGGQAGATYGGTGASITNLGHSGDTLATIIGRGATTDTHYDGAKTQNLLFIMGGTNDLTDTSTVNATFLELLQYCDSRRAAGWQVIVHTLFDALPRAPGFDAARTAYNALIRLMRQRLGVAIVDCGASFAMGRSGPQDAANFGADGEHPNAAGNQILANYAQMGLAWTANYGIST